MASVQEATFRIASIVFSMARSPGVVASGALLRNECWPRFQDETAIGSKFTRAAIGGPASKDVRIGQDLGIAIPI